MAVESSGRVLYVVACAAGPAGEVGKLVDAALQDSWIVQVIVTPTGRDFVDVVAVESRTGRPVRSEYLKPGETHFDPLPKADAIIVAPATFNTINKWAHGISDTYALGVLAECTAFRLPIVVLPFVNSALASRRPFKRNVAALREEGIRVLLGKGEFEPHEPGTGGSRIDAFPWKLALKETERLLSLLQGGGPLKASR